MKSPDGRGVVASSVLPDADARSDEFHQLLSDALNQTEQVLNLLGHGLAGHMNSIGGKLTESK